MTCATYCACCKRITETLAAQALYAILTIADVELSHTIRTASNMRGRVVAGRVRRALTLLRQHFLKRDAVFSNVLVYSGCSASRFPNARSDQAISLHQEGNMAKKAKKAKKAKSAVKKTAKKVYKKKKK